MSDVWQVLPLASHSQGVERGKSIQADYQKVMSMKYNGDLQLYLDQVDQVMMDCQADMDPMFLLTLIEPQLRACKHMSTYFIAYDLAESGSPDKTLEFLWNAA